MLLSVALQPASCLGLRRPHSIVNCLRIECLELKAHSVPLKRLLHVVSEVLSIHSSTVTRLYAWKLMFKE